LLFPGNCASQKYRKGRICWNQIIRAKFHVDVAADTDIRDYNQLKHYQIYKIPIDTEIFKSTFQISIQLKLLQYPAINIKK